MSAVDQLLTAYRCANAASFFACIVRRRSAALGSDQAFPLAGVASPKPLEGIAPSYPLASAARSYPLRRAA